MSLILMASEFMFTGCSSCQSENKPQENVVDNKDSSGMLPEPAPIVVENCISADRQAMFLKCNKDTSVYRWFESSIVLKDYLNADPDGEVESLSLFIGEEEFTLPTLKAEEILDRIQLYADRCFIVTKQHKIAVEYLDTIEAVDSYDYTGDYPDNLEFVL